ncbi:MAG TPA: hypothetical protein VEY67_04005, partial [Candidatus Dormibacteraeota bacterium]|nr:hypothetical protein [Candidatus Dormibacteraeota bacterium]
TARVVLAAVLDVLDAGRAPDASPELPGWRLVEHDRQQDREHAQADGRTLRVDASKAAPERHP